jgi:hypothetical protein
MAKKKSKKKIAKPKKASSKEKSSARQAASKKLALKKPSPKKRLATKSPAKKSSAKPKAAKKKTATAKPVETRTRQASGRRRSFAEEPYRSQESISDSAGQSGDLQGLSNVEGADSESVDELVEEGNAFEADVISGVERAGRDEGQEVHTHEVPEDDVPSEYLDEE